MTTFNARLRSYLTAPAHLSRAEQRSFSTASATFPSACIIHVSFIGLFLWLDQPVMAAVNVVSVFIWIVALFQARRNHFLLAGTLIAAEIMAHAILAVHQLGTEFGFQYYVLTLGSGVFILKIPRWSQWLIIAISGALFIVLSLQPAVPWTGNPLTPTVLSIMNIASVVGLIALMGSYSHAVTTAAEAALEAEHAKSEGLLRNILPDVIAERLKQEDGTIADGFASISVLFADIADFTALSQRMTPAEVVTLLDDLFSRFDALVRQYRLEKIKTIGDSYMVAAGVPIPRADHAEVMARFAGEMQQAVCDYNDQHGTTLRMRIGINSGPVVAGVIGKMRFLYDLWGDSVNTASRMESHGVPGEIQISEQTKALLEGKYRVEERGMIEIKGKGPMRTYFLREPLLQPVEAMAHAAS